MLEKREDITTDSLRRHLANGQEPTAADIAATEAALLPLAQMYAKPLPLSLRDQIMGKIQHLNAQKTQRNTISLDDVPLLTPQANYLDWAEAVQGIAPPDPMDNIYLHPIRSDDTVDMFVAWVRDELPLEVHHDLLESFLILEGACACQVYQPDGTVRTVYMREGDFISFCIGEDHEIIVTSPEPVKAILQWLKMAA